MSTFIAIPTAVQMSSVWLLWRGQSGSVLLKCGTTYASHCVTADVVKLVEAEWRIYVSENLPSLVQIMACFLDGAKPLSETMMVSSLLIEPLGTNFNEISIRIQTFSFKKMHLNMLSAKLRPFCLGLNVLITIHTQHECLPNVYDWIQFCWWVSFEEDSKIMVKQAD